METADGGHIHNPLIHKINTGPWNNDSKFHEWMSGPALINMTGGDYQLY